MRTKTKGMNVKLWLILDKRKISNQALANKTGLSIWYISKVLHNRIGVTDARKLVIAKALRLKVADVF